MTENACWNYLLKCQPYRKTRPPSHRKANRSDPSQRSLVESLREAIFAFLRGREHHYLLLQQSREVLQRGFLDDGGLMLTASSQLSQNVTKPGRRSSAAASRSHAVRDWLGVKSKSQKILKDNFFCFVFPWLLNIISPVWLLHVCPWWEFWLCPGGGRRGL